MAARKKHKSKAAQVHKARSGGHRPTRAHESKTAYKRSRKKRELEKEMQEGGGKKGPEG